jgi:hypothetical protein
MKLRGGFCLSMLLLFTRVSVAQFPGTPTETITVGHLPHAVVNVGTNLSVVNTNLAVANSGDNTVTVLVGSCTTGPASCNYTARGPFAVGADPTSIDRGHFRGPGSPFDLVTANNVDGTVSVLLNQPNGIFAPQTAIAAGPDPLTVVVGDFNMDGYDDIAVTNGTGLTPTVTVLLNKGNCTYPSVTPCSPAFTSASYPLPGSNLPWGIAKGNFAGKGAVDLVVANFYSAGYGADGAEVLLNEITPGISYTLFPPSATPAASFSGSPVELGVKFQSSAAGLISGIRFYKRVGDTGTHIGNLWTGGGQLLATARFTRESSSGWQQVNFSPPVPITAGTTYIASYFTSQGYYAADANYFTTAVNSVPYLTAPASSCSGNCSGGNGLYAYSSTSTFPTSTFFAANYWVDVVFSLPVTAPTPLFGAATAYPGGFYAPYIVAGDFTTATKDDFAITNYLGYVRIFTNNGSGSFTEVTPLSPANFTADGIANAGHLSTNVGSVYDDLVVSNLYTGTVTVLYSNSSGSGVFTPQPPITVGDSPWAVLVADLGAGGGQKALVVVNRDSNNIYIFEQ